MQFKKKTKGKLRTCHGASATEYAALLGVLGVVAIGSVFAMGGDVKDAFAAADAQLASARQEQGGDIAPP